MTRRRPSLADVALFAFVIAMAFLAGRESIRKLDAEEPVIAEREVVRVADPTWSPPEFAIQCRNEGLEFVASNTDGAGWIYECVRIRLRRS